MLSERNRTILFGDSTSVSKLWMLVATVLFVPSLGYFSLVKAFGYPEIYLFLWWE